MNKHSDCESCLTGFCLCYSCKNDYGKNESEKKHGCCIDRYGMTNCPVNLCPDYILEEENKQ